MAVKGNLASWPDSLSDLTIKAEARDGKLITRTSLNVDEIIKLVSAFQAQTAKK